MARQVTRLLSKARIFGGDQLNERLHLQITRTLQSFLGVTIHPTYFFLLRSLGQRLRRRPRSHALNGVMAQLFHLPGQPTMDRLLGKPGDDLPVAAQHPVPSPLFQ